MTTLFYPWLIQLDIRLQMKTRLKRLSVYQTAPWMKKLQSDGLNDPLHLIFRIISWLCANFDTCISTFTLTYLQSCMARSWNVLLKFPISVKIFAYFLVNVAMYHCLVVQLNFNEFPTPKAFCFGTIFHTIVTIISHKKLGNCRQSKIEASL